MYFKKWNYGIIILGVGYNAHRNFSDIHGNKEALTAIIEDIKKENIDEVICLGDTIGIGPNPKECLDLIINNNIKMVFRKL